MSVAVLDGSGGESLGTIEWEEAAYPPQYPSTKLPTHNAKRNYNHNDLNPTYHAFKEHSITKGKSEKTTFDYIT
eukprot:3173748-Amphidinium_carterae.1